jgi:REP element-mobilizing transposase RayT
MLSRRTGALHAHRWSQPADRYFVTCCTRFRAPGLTNASVSGVVNNTIVTLDEHVDVTTHAFTVMPDHVHWLFTLGGRLSLGRVIARMKAQTRDALAGVKLTWQRDFFEHRLRAKESIESYGLYVFLNPYRAGLIPAGEKWPYWRCPEPGRFDFMPRLDSGGTPPVEWIIQSVPKGVTVGE